MKTLLQDRIFKLGVSKRYSRDQTKMDATSAEPSIQTHIEPTRTISSSSSSLSYSSQQQKKNLGTVVFQPQGSPKAFKASIYPDSTLERLDSQMRYDGVLQFIEAIELEMDSESRTSLEGDYGRVSLSRGTKSNSFEQDFVFEKDPLAGIKMDHSNVWL